MTTETRSTTDGTMNYDAGSHRAYVEGLTAFSPSRFPACSMKPETYRSDAARQAFFCGWHDAQGARRRQRRAVSA